jgi:hypothetical protein
VLALELRAGGAAAPVMLVHYGAVRAGVRTDVSLAAAVPAGTGMQQGGGGDERGGHDEHGREGVFELFHGFQ